MVEVKKLSIEEIFEQYYNILPKEQYKGFKNAKSIENRCCKNKSLVNNSGEVVCKFCGWVYHYKMVSEKKKLLDKAKVKISKEISYKKH